MSDGNITHHHSPKKVNTSLGASPEKLRVRTTSTSSNGSLSPIKSSLKRPACTSSEEEVESENNMLIKSSNITSVFASMDFKSAKKSFSRLPNLSKKPRMSLEEPPSDIRILPSNNISSDNSTPLTG